MKKTNYKTINRKTKLILLILLLSFKKNAFSQFSNAISNPNFTTNLTGWTASAGTGTWARSGSFSGVASVTADGTSQTLTQSVSGLTSGPVSGQVTIYFDLYAGNNGGTNGATVSDLSVSLNGTTYAVFSNPTGAGSVTASASGGATITNFSTGVVPTTMRIVSSQIQVTFSYAGPATANLEFTHNSPTSGTDNWAIDNVKIETSSPSVCPYVVPTASGARVCPLNLVNVTSKRPETQGNLLTQLWYGADDLGNSSSYVSYTSGFSGTDACGHPAHANAPTNSNFTYGEVTKRIGFDDDDVANPTSSAAGATGRSNGQQDGWLMVPPGLTCIQFRIGGISNGESSALFAGSNCGTMTLVGEYFSSAATFTDFNYTLPTNLPTIGNCGWRALRIRFYETDGFTASNSWVKWNIGDGYVYPPAEFLQPVSTPTSNDNLPSEMVGYTCKLAFEDAEGKLFLRTTAGGVGSIFALDQRFCEEIEVIEENVRANGSCTPVFSCGVTPVKVIGYSPNGTSLLNQSWSGTDDIGDICMWNCNDATSGFTGPFIGANDALGLPTHNGGAPTNSNNTCITTLGVTDGACGLNGTLGAGVAARENVQQDGWLVVPEGVTCLSFQLGDAVSPSANSGALYVIEPNGNLVLVNELNSFNLNYAYFETYGSYCLTGDEPEVGSGFRLLRVRYYHHDGHDASDTRVRWNIGAGFVLVPSTNLFPAASPTSLTLPAFSETTVSTRYALLDEKGTLWAANGSSKPTTALDISSNLSIVYDIQEITDCSAQPAPTSGPTCASTLAADPCEVEADLIDPCQCDNPNNIFADPTNYRSVTLFNENAIVESMILTGFSVVGGSGLYDNTGAPLTFPIAATTSGTDDGVNFATFTFYAKPDEPYDLIIADNTGTIVENLSGLCGTPNGCNCQAKPEVCGDGVDNDFDGLVDAADGDIAGDCIKNCPLTPIKVQGKTPVADGRVTTQLWTRYTTPKWKYRYNALKNTSPISSINGILKYPFSGTDVNGLPMHVNGAAGTFTSGPLSGQSATTTRFRSAGFAENTSLSATYGFSIGRSDQLQQDFWLIIPPNATCFEVRINNPKRWDATALYLGSSVTDLELVGESYGIGKIKSQIQGTYRAPSGTEVGINYEYDATSDPNSSASSLATCGYLVLRARLYSNDVGVYMNSKLMWNIGNGWEVIPKEYVQSVGTTAASANADGNKPSTLKSLPGKCIFQDADGDLFDTDGNPYALDPSICEAVSTDPCIKCISTNIACISVDTTEIQYTPTCGVQPYQITYRTLNDTAGSLYTQYWELDSAEESTGNVLNQPYIKGFQDYFTLGPSCPNCYPVHVHDSTGVLYSNILGLSSDATITDVDGNSFRPIRVGVRSREQVQQDAWLIVPGELKQIEFKLGGGVRWDASALYIGTHIDSMVLVGENYNRKGRKPYSYVTYNVPTTAKTSSGCSKPYKLLRLRFYHHDNGTRSNSEILWNIGNGFQRIPAKYFRPAKSACSNTFPGISSTFTNGATVLGIQDTSGIWFNYTNASYPAVDNGTNSDSTAFVAGSYDTLKVSGCDVITPICGTPADVNNMCNICATYAVLPIQFIKFNAECLNNEININWSVNYKNNVSNYQLMRSLDNGKTWVNVFEANNSLFSTNINDFKYIDQIKSDKIILYQIVENNKDGKSEKSDIIRISSCNKNNVIYTVTISPNPTSNLLAINLSQLTTLLRIKLFNQQGKEILNYIIKDTNSSFLNLENLADGVYYIYIDSDYGTQMQKIIKIKE